MQPEMEDRGLWHAPVSHSPVRPSVAPVAPTRPKYLAIYEDMRQQILDGRLQPGTQLVAQHELAASYGVTLMTFRQAMAQLESDGLIWVSRGRGSFVVDQPVSVRVGNLTSFAEQMRDQGLELTTEVLSIGSPVDASAARQALDLPRARLVEIQRVRRVSGRPVVLQRTVLAASLAKHIDRAALAETSLYELISTTSGRRVARALETLRAVLLSETDAALLEQEVGAPAIESVRTSLTVDNTPFLFDRALLVGDAASIDADRTNESLDLRYRLRV